MTRAEGWGPVVVAHSGRQHSERAARACVAHGLATAYWTGLPLGGPVLPGLSVSIRPFAPVLRRLLGAMSGQVGESWGDYLGTRLFDAWAARRIGRSGARCAIGYEVGFQKTIRAARRSGMAAILDAASVHYLSQERWAGRQSPRSLERRIVAIKRDEIESCDHIVVASELAARSYREAGLPGERVSVVPLGVDLETFRPGDRTEASGLAALFVGKMTPVKGFDVLLEAWRELAQERPAVRLRVAGQGRRPPGLPEGTVAAPVPHSELPPVYAAADVLILPSRLDGFGLVVSEALACGTPVIVSDHVGAGDLIREGVNGWIVAAGDVAALRARMLWCSDHLGEVRSMRTACRASIEPFGWDAYGRRFVEVVDRVLAERSA